MAAGDLDTDGISTGDAIDLNGGTITATTGGANANLALGTHKLTNDGPNLVDGVARHSRLRSGGGRVADADFQQDPERRLLPAGGRLESDR